MDVEEYKSRRLPSGTFYYPQSSDDEYPLWKHAVFIFIALAFFASLFLNARLLTEPETRTTVDTVAVHESPVPPVSYHAAVMELRECERDKISMTRQGRSWIKHLQRRLKSAE